MYVQADTFTDKSLLFSFSGSYFFFCKAARDIEVEMMRLGAKRLHPLGLGDDSAEEGLDEGLHNWLDGIWPVSLKHILIHT